MNFAKKLKKVTVELSIYEKNYIHKKKVKKIIEDNIHPMMHRKKEKMLKELGLNDNSDLIEMDEAKYDKFRN